MADPTAPPAGWLLDPDDHSLLRWWDGSGWAAFRRPREVPADSPAAGGTSTVTTAAWAPRPAAPTGSPRRVQLAKLPTAPAPTTDPVATAPADGGPTAAEVLAGSWDTAVDALLAITPGARRPLRATVLTASRPDVLRSAFPDEEVFEAFDVTLHARHALTGGLGAPLGEAGLFVTDRRLVIVADDLRVPLREILLDEIVAVDLIGRGAMRFDLTDLSPPLLLTSRRGHQGGEIAELVMTLLDF